MKSNTSYFFARSLKKKRMSPSTRPFVHVFLGCFFLFVFLHVLMQVSLIRNINDKDVQHSVIVNTVDARRATQLTRPLGQQTEQKLGPTVVVSGDDVGCECDIVSTDCLDSIKCLPSSESESMQLMALGVTTRHLLKQMTRFEGEGATFGSYPMGKGLQYNFTRGYQTWKRELVLPVGMYKGDSTIFVNETWYPYCRKRNIKGKACFLGDLEPDEELDDMETTALANVHIPNRTKEQINTDLLEFHNRTNTGGVKIPALGYLLVFAHLARIHFHRTPPVLEFYHKRIKSVINIVPTKQQHHESHLRVSLHLRRADSCDHEREGYEKKASKLDSVAQAGGNRVCYDTSVYTNALQRVQEKCNRPIDVYLSTDDAGSVTDEIQRRFPDLWKSMNWHYLDYSRDTFQYTGSVEGDEIDATQQAMLGESAIADLWHVSHGEVYIGHLGSRFGKVSWLLATARYNRFIPFFTVDGHSFCCEIDEQCHNMKPYITSMDSCMTFATELSSVPLNKDYWEVGSTVRKIAAERKKSKKRKKKAKKKEKAKKEATTTNKRKK